MSDGTALFWLIPAAPLLAFCLLALGLARPSRRLAGWLSVAALIVSTALSFVALATLWQSPGKGQMAALPWMAVGGRQLQLALWLDPMGAIGAALVSLVALVVFVYATAYMADDPRVARFFTVLSLFAGAMLTLVLAADLITLFIAWEIVGICSYLLIGFWFERPDVPPAATKAFLTTRLGDLFMLAGVLLLIGTVGNGRIDTMLAGAGTGRLSPAFLALATLLLFMGAAGKSAQLPFQGWLPDAMLGPTPVSALLHSATMVAAGVFLVARLYPLFQASGWALSVVAWVGAVTALLGACAALVQADLKRTLAYSTISQLGLMFTGLGAGSLLAGVLLLVGQALFKALLFLVAGVLGHVVGGTGFERMGGLARRLPWAFAAFCVGAAALAGLPVTLALPPKDPTLAAAWKLNGGLFAIVLLASLLTALYSARALGLAFLGPQSEQARRASGEPARSEQDNLRALLLPTLTLAAIVPLGLLADAALLGNPLSRFLGAATPESAAATALGLGVAVVGVTLGLWARRAWPASLVWPPIQKVVPIFAGEFGMVALYAMLGRAGIRVSLAFSSFDRLVFDAAAGKIASGTLRLIRAGARFDLRRLDAFSTGIGDGLISAGQRLRALQTGHIENYLLMLFVWSLGALVLAAIFLFIRGSL